MPPESRAHGCRSAPAPRGGGLRVITCCPVPTKCKNCSCHLPGRGVIFSATSGMESGPLRGARLASEVPTEASISTIDQHQERCEGLGPSSIGPRPRRQRVQINRKRNDAADPEQLEARGDRPRGPRAHPRAFVMAGTARSTARASSRARLFPLPPPNAAFPHARDSPLPPRVSARVPFGSLPSPPGLCPSHPFAHSGLDFS